MLLRWFGRKLPGWISWIPALIIATPELTGILMETLQAKRRLREALVWVFLTPVYWVCVVIGISLSPRRTLRSWWKKLSAWVVEKPRRIAMLRALEAANSYEEWLEIANLLDKSYATDKW